MCLAIPMRLVDRDRAEGRVEVDGVGRTVSLMLVPEAVAGDWLLVHAGYAITRVTLHEAHDWLRTLRDLDSETGPLPERVVAE